jgi:hypothetical protein
MHSSRRKVGMRRRGRHVPSMAAADHQPAGAGRQPSERTDERADAHEREQGPSAVSPWKTSGHQRHSTEKLNENVKMTAITTRSAGPVRHTW